MGTSEIGIRIAVGAMPRSILWMIVGETLALVSAGMIVGVPIALGLGRYVSSLLFGLPSNDAGTIAAVVAMMGIVAVCAPTGPSLRASAPRSRCARCGGSDVHAGESRSLDRAVRRWVLQNCGISTYA